MRSSLRPALVVILALPVLGGCGPSGEETAMPVPFANDGEMLGQTGGSVPALPPDHPPLDTGMSLGMDPSVSAEATEGGFIAAGVQFTVPQGWVEETPASSMRLAQYSLPGEAGPAELTVFCFGPGQGGSTQANIDRWVGQFSAEGGPAEPEITTSERDGLTITVVKVTGAFTPGSMGMMAPAQEPIADAALHGVIIEGGPQGAVFVKVTGPRTTIEAQAEALEAFTQSARLRQAQ